jgi:hypothetical protein
LRIPFPTHISLWRATVFAVSLALIQMYQGTSPTFALCSFLFVVLFVVTFNTAGGFSSTTGSYVFFFAVLVVILGLCWKVILGESGDSNLLQPELTMEIYVGTIMSMWLAVVISKKLRSKRPLLGNLVTDANMYDAAVGCAITGIILFLISTLAERVSGSAQSALSQLNHFLPLAIIFGVIHEVRRTGGRRSVSLPVVVASAAAIILGLAAYSKELIFTPVACWAIAAASQGYRLKRLQIIGLLLGGYLMVHYLVPYSQYGRNFRPEDDNFWGGIDTSIALLSDPEGTREEYLKRTADDAEEHGSGYFSKPQGLMDRLQMIGPDDELHDLTERRGQLGIYPIIFDFENLVPHVLWPGKPSINFGNFYAHQMGHLSDDDVTTGISFSPAGEAYHLGKWIGVFVWAPILWIMMFTLFDSLCGDPRTSPWGLLTCSYYAHLAPEKMLNGVVYSLGVVAFGLVFAALCAAYLMPLLAALVKPPARTQLRTAMPVRSFVGRVRSFPAPGSGQL